MFAEFNRQRDKTPAQVINEFDEILAIERDRAAKRRQATQNNDAATEVEEFPQQDSGKARDKAAAKVDAAVSGRTLEKGKTVKDLATEP